MARSGNGLDIAALHELLTQVIARLDRQQATLDEHGRMLNEHGRKLNEIVDVVNEHTRRLDNLERRLDHMDVRLDDLDAGLRDLRSTVDTYHQSVVSHGVLYTEVDDRLRAVERQLKRDPAPG